MSWPFAISRLLRSDGSAVPTFGDEDGVDEGIDGLDASKRSGQDERGKVSNS